MSLSVFPSEIGQDGNGLDRWSFRLPIKKTPSFKTLKAVPANNVGQVRVSLTQFPIWQFELDLAYMRGDLTTAQLGCALQQILGFFGQVQGSADDWLYFDPWDNGSSSTIANANPTNPTYGPSQLTYNSIGVGDGVTTQFLMTRGFGGLTDLVQNFVTGYPLVYVGGVQQASNQFTIDPYGRITFNIAPPLNSVVSWFGQFYFRCHFLDDEWKELRAFAPQLWDNSSFRFESLLR